MHQMKKLIPYGAVSLIMSCITLAIYHFSGIGRQVVSVETEPAVPTVQARQLTYELPESNDPPDFRLSARRAMPAVVHIVAAQTRVQQAYAYDPFYELFGLRPRQQNRQSISSGSGVIISAEGYIVTNNHVVQGADQLEVTLFDNRTFPATLIGTDPSTDLGLIKIEADNLAAIDFTNSDEVEVGQWVLAVGNPFNLASTATAGIVSAIGRDLEIIKDRMAIESFIQTDAAVNPGNSGGALVNLEGKLVGINTAIASPTGAYAGYAFAVPANIVSKVVEDLRLYGQVQRGFLGLHAYESLNNVLAKELGLDITEGVLVEQLYVDGAAKKAGIQAGDVIVSIDGKPVKNEAKLREMEGRFRPGDEVTVTVNRNGKLKSFKLKLTNQYGTTELLGNTRNQILSELGIEVSPLPAGFLQKYGMEAGIYVSDILPGKISRDTRMRKGFIILRVDGRKVTSEEQLTNYLASARGVVEFEGFYENDRYIYSYKVEL
ncbi:MAG: PDZ domain-containing protein [Bacteroidetes bacterium]|nr:MAG: PDZ domain-containing protein [Bacteroidota bacterium]